jgi:hypothetical protein
MTFQFLNMATFVNKRYFSADNDFKLKMLTILVNSNDNTNNSEELRRDFNAQQ